MSINRFALLLLSFSILLVTSGCNYNYYRGMELEEQGRYEEANIEFHRAYTSSPNDDDFQDAYRRTAVKTTEDLLERYESYVKEKKYRMAYKRLEKANTLTPDNPRVKEEMKKWYRILLAGKVDLVKLQAMNNQIPLTDQIVLEIRFNTPNITRRLEAPIDYQTNIFAVEDILYDPPQNLLMLYSINSIGVKLVNNATRRSQFKKFIDFRIPVLVDVQGELSPNGSSLTSVDDFYPIGTDKNYQNPDFWYPAPGIRYSLQLNNSEIVVSSSNKKIDFLPQMLYINKADQRYFLDFGDLQLAQKKRGGLWTYRRVMTEDRGYLKELEKNLILHPYFYFREGGYPYVLAK